MHHYTREDLSGFKPQHAVFVGIDSDGCVFDTMEIKQKQCFHPAIIKHWGLEKLEKELRMCAEFVNLYSRYRGQNRFPALSLTFKLLREMPAAMASGITIPSLPAIDRWIASGAVLGNPDLEKLVKKTHDLELASVLAWSLEINRRVADTVKKVEPFPWAAASLPKIHSNSDAICVSQTPTEALVREWEENNLTRFVSIIAGQELGTKTEHIAMAAGNKYPPHKILMIGDAMGDLKAASANGALFYPIEPGREDASWKRFHDEAFDRFLAGTFAGKYQDNLVREFETLLPATPPWKEKTR